MNTVTILGIPFYTGTTAQAVDLMLSSGGLLVVPAAPALRTIAEDPVYRRSLLEADVVIPDSAYMVILWNRLVKDRSQKIHRVSGLAYLRELLLRPGTQQPGSTFWVMAGEQSSNKNLAYLASQGIHVPPSCVYNAPMYGAGDLRDEALLQAIETLRPPQIVITIGGGTQERLGLYLRDHLSYRPAIQCIGAAIAFLSGDQVPIPAWADKYYLGWFLRAFSEPKRYVPRYISALGLAGMIWKYREKTPPLRS